MIDGQRFAAHTLRRMVSSLDMLSRPRWTQVQPQGVQGPPCIMSMPALLTLRSFPAGRTRKPCEGHTISVVGKCLYLLFGKHEADNGNPICPPMQVLDTETMLLSTPCFAHGPDGQHNKPADREGHSASAVGLRIVVFGGTWTNEEDSTIYKNDMHLLDTSILRWDCPSFTGTPPIEREGHTAATIGARIFFFGGEGALRLSHIPTHVTPPHSRQAFTPPGPVALISCM